ncbi:MAG TPA: Ig-like domain-containing protein [Anaerolineae bacterium]|nr:Ig-like domain-containing protein [Anaerolineae bacterium]
MNHATSAGVRGLRLLMALALMSGAAPMDSVPAAGVSTGTLEAPLAPQAVNITATKTDALLADNDGDNRADPGDTLRYTVVITNSGDADATAVVLDDTIDDNTVFVPGSVRTTPLARNDSYGTVGNVQLSVSAPGVLNNDSDPDGTGGLTVTSFDATSANGGHVSVAANGSFTYNPPPGFSGADTFTYTVDDGEGNTDQATVSITVGQVVWFIDNAVGGPGDGRFTSPFSSVANFNSLAADDPGDYIFVYQGSGAYPGAFTLLNNQQLIGHGVGLTIAPNLSIAAASRPTISNVALASGNTVRGLNVNTSSGTGIGGASVGSLTINNVSVTNTAGAGVSLSSGALAVTFDSVSASNGTNGIVLNNTTGSFTVTGSGGTCTEANTSGCSGGTIQNMTGGDDSSIIPVGTGIVLNNAANVSLTRMYIHDTSNYGIRGTSVNGFSLATSVVGGVNGTNVATPFNDGSLSFDNLAGTSTITNSAISGGYQRNVRVDNTSGTLNLTVSNSSIHDTGATAGDDGLFVEVGGGSATLNVTNNTFSAHGGDHFNLSLLGSPTVDLTFTGNFWTGGHAIGLGQGLFILGASFNGTFTYDILNNGTVANPLVGNRQGGAMHVNKGSGTGTFSGTISNNVIGNPAVNSSGSSEASGIDVEAHGAGGSHTTVISNNLVRQFHNDGILLLAGEGNAALNATVTGNTVSNPDASIASFHGMHFNIGTLPTDALLACLDVKNNSLTGAGADGDNGTPNNGGQDLRMRQRQLTTVRLPGYGGANNDNAAVQTFLTVTNGNAVTTIGAVNTVATGGGGFVGGAACSLPTVMATTQEYAQLDNQTTAAAPRGAQIVANGGSGKPLLSPAFNPTPAPAARPPHTAGEGRSQAFALQRDRAVEIDRVGAPITPLSIGTLPAGKAITITFDVTINNPVPPGVTQVSNQGAVSGGNFSPVVTDDPDTGTPSDATVTPLDIEIDLRVTKTVNPAAAYPGLPITYTVVYSNAGPQASANVVITDQIPSALTGVSYQSSATITPTGPFSYVWNVGSLLNGQGGVITVTGVISPALLAPTTITNTVTITGAGRDTNIDNNTASVALPVSDLPISGLSATNDSPTLLGSAATFTATAAGSNVTYQWNFGDGMLGNGAITTHTYAAAGAYTAIVTATNGVSQVTATTNVLIFTSRIYLPLVMRNFGSASELIVITGVNAQASDPLVIHGP